MHFPGLVEHEFPVVEDTVGDDVGHHVGPASGAVDGEEAHGGEGEIKQAMVGVAHHLSGDLGGRVGGQGATQGVVLAEGELLGASVDGGSGGEDEVRDTCLAGRF